ncbi:MAG: signal recognition particle-docking protein FtsY [Bifidobacteriaceae bacterium]|jgi:fused signal recognition particle receptor|nr:signal recognition particle-docking protein FtsY [Bifidobacteriaceae bacterium]
MTPEQIVIVVVAIVVLLAGLAVGLWVSRRKGTPPMPPATPTPPATPVAAAKEEEAKPAPVTPGQGAKAPPAAEVSDAAEVSEAEAAAAATSAAEPGAGAPSAAEADEAEPSVAPPAAAIETPEAATSRLQRLRARLAGSKSALGKALLAVLSRDQLTQDDWDEFEESLLLADVGAGAAEDILTNVRQTLRVKGGEADPAEALRQELLAAVNTAATRDIAWQGQDGQPGIILVVGVNGSGKTTTIGRLARLEVAEGRTVLLGAADTFRAAAAEQLTTWGERVGVKTVRGPEGSDPAAVAFEAVEQGLKQAVDTVIIDTAGRLHNKANLMDELGKIKRVASRQAPITETLLVLDATTGQNGLTQARVFTEAVDVTGIVLTKLDGTAKGGIVIAVQRELGVPVKLVGLGEGPDDLAPFDPAAFVDGLLGR